MNKAWIWFLSFRYLKIAIKNLIFKLRIQGRLDIPQSSHELKNNWYDVGPKVPEDLSCDSCGRKFKSWADLSKHSKAPHFKDDFKCDSCDFFKVG